MARSRFLSNLIRLALVCVSVFVWSTSGLLAQTDSFDQMIEDALKRHPPGAAPPPGDEVPVAPDAEPAPPDFGQTPPDVAPIAPEPAPGGPPVPPLDGTSPVPPALLQDQGGPKPYTPPK